MRLNRQLVLTLALISALAQLAAAQPKAKLLDKETFFLMESVSSPQIAPDGSAVVSARGFVDIMKDQNSSNLWIIDVKGERLRQLTDGSWRDSAPVWSPDGKRIAFVSDRSGSAQVHVMWADTRETLQLTRVERAPGGLKWSPDGRFILFTRRGQSRMARS
jgi:Tol biopolymer transport system component